MYRLNIDKKKAYKYDTRNGEFDYYLDGDVIHVSAFSSEKRAERLVQLAHVYKLASGSRRMVTRAMMILLAKGFDTKRLADRVVREVGAPQEIRAVAQSILTEYFYNRARVSLSLLSVLVARRLIGKAVFPPNCEEREDFPRKDLKNDAIAKKREDTESTLAPTPPLAKAHVATPSGIEVPRCRPRVIQSPEIDEPPSNVDGSNPPPLCLAWGLIVQRLKP